MKTSKIFFVCILLLSFLFSNCEGEDNSKPPYSYDLKIKIVNQSNEDRVHGIELEKKVDDKERTEVKKSAYMLDSVGIDRSKKRIFRSPLYISTIDGYDYLDIKTSTFQPYHPLQLTFNLICHYIFGDYEAHTIVSNWEVIPSKVYVHKCTSITVDGKPCSILGIDTEDLSTLVLVKLDN